MKPTRYLLACLAFAGVLALAQFAFADVAGVPRIQGVANGAAVPVSLTGQSVTSSISGITNGQKTSANSLPVVPASDYAPANSTVGPTTISVACTDANINACGANSTVSLAVNGQGYASLKVVNSTATYMLKADYSIDGGTTWEAGSLVDAAGVVTSSTSYTASSVTAVYGLLAPKGGVSHWRARAGVSITNTFTAYLAAGYMAPAPSLVTQPVSGTVAATLTGQSVTSSISGGTLAVSQSGTWSGVGVTGTFWPQTQTSTITGSVAVTLTGQSVTSTGLAQGSTTSGQTGFLMMGTATSTPPTRSGDTTYPLSLTLQGGLRTTGSDLSEYTTTATSTTATTLFQLVALSGSLKTYILNWKCSASGAATTTADQQCLLKYGTGTACATGTTLLDGCFNPATGGCNGGQIVVPAGQAVCGIHAAAGTKIFSLTYKQGL